MCHASQEFSASLKITEPLCSLIFHHDLLYSEVKPLNFLRNPQSDHLSRSAILRVLLILIFISICSLRLALDLAVEREASTWLTALPLDEYGFALHKSAFQDVLALHYGWLPLCIPIHCACGAFFLLNTLNLVLKVGYLLFDIMK